MAGDTGRGDTGSLVRSGESGHWTTQNQPPMQTGQGGMPQAQQPRPQLSPEEMAVLKECQTESFWYRCVPLGLLFVGTTQILTNKGILKPNPKFGALLKNLGASLVAFMVGKVSYQKTCVDKILKLENSTLAENIRRGKRDAQLMPEMKLPGLHGGGEPVDQPVEGQTPRAYQSDSMNLNTEANVQYKGLDESSRPSLDRDVKLPNTAEVDDKNVTYEELRRRNRENFSPYSPPPSRAPQPEKVVKDPVYNQPKRARVNKYGDIIED